MSEAQFTPGEWLCVGGTDSYMNIIGNCHDAKESKVAKFARPGEVAAVGVCRVYRNQDCDANVRLITAAPDLLALALAVIAEAEYLPHTLAKLRAQAEAAVAKVNQQGVEA